ncbi:hypothetical protein [Stenotrophomonas pavanii]|uniref:hypothetical protein n=1 Tax=Stenotrophomonas pavanii TaxID=487698 RepID=UPI0039C669E4
MDNTQVSARDTALSAEQVARHTGHPALAIPLAGSTDARIDRLVGIIEQQVKQIAELAMHVGLLVQAVAQLLGEEAGTPVQDEGAEPERVDLDGKPY